MGTNPFKYRKNQNNLRSTIEKWQENKETLADDIERDHPNSRKDEPYKERHERFRPVKESKPKEDRFETQEERYNRYYYTQKERDEKFGYDD